ncbi:MAG: 50S ribosomal protein L11 [Microgenomates bacterium OLB22]|nr:MAG: 50S ribosomal protein L11 [Microgenomates bacterium OLB22]
MAKKIKTFIKVNLKAGEATPAPPVGPALGQHGIPIMDFIQQYNDRTKDLRGKVIPAVITLYEDNSFTFVTKLPPISEMIKSEAKIQKGSGIPNKTKVGSLTDAQVESIAKEKMQDLNAFTVEAAKEIVKGTARSMGVTIKD